jgi:hypothetical protein
MRRLCWLPAPSTLPPRSPSPSSAPPRPPPAHLCGVVVRRRRAAGPHFARHLLRDALGVSVRVAGVGLKTAAVLGRECVATAGLTLLRPASAPPPLCSPPPAPRAPHLEQHHVFVHLALQHAGKPGGGGVELEWQVREGVVKGGRRAAGRGAMRRCGGAGSLSVRAAAAAARARLTARGWTGSGPPRAAARSCGGGSNGGRRAWVIERLSRRRRQVQCGRHARQAAGTPLQPRRPPRAGSQRRVGGGALF